MDNNELIAVEDAYQESEANLTELFNDLLDRGMA